jgi:hypothetical protein
VVVRWKEARSNYAPASWTAAALCRFYPQSLRGKRATGGLPRSTTLERSLPVARTSPPSPAASAWSRRSEAETDKSAVSRVSQPAARPDGQMPCRFGNRRHSRFGNLRYGCDKSGCQVGTARCAVRAAYQRRNVRREACSPFRPLNAGGDIAARCPYHPVLITPATLATSFER